MMDWLLALPLPVILLHAALALALLLALARLLIGPAVADRVVALDLIGMIVTATIAVNAFLGDQPLYLDVLLVLSIVIFFGTVALARYLEKQLTDDR